MYIFAYCYTAGDVVSSRNLCDHKIMFGICDAFVLTRHCRYYRSVPRKAECPLPGKCPCTPFQGVNVAAKRMEFWSRVSAHAGQNC